MSGNLEPLADYEAMADEVDAAPLATIGEAVRSLCDEVRHLRGLLADDLALFELLLASDAGRNHLHAHIDQLRRALGARP